MPATAAGTSLPLDSRNELLLSPGMKATLGIRPEHVGVTRGTNGEIELPVRLVEPLGMNGVTFTTPDIPKDADRALGHRLNKAGKVERMPTYEMKEPNPSGSMNATPRDLAAWLQFHISDGVAPSGRRLV